MVSLSQPLQLAMDGGELIAFTKFGDGLLRTSRHQYNCFWTEMIISQLVQLIVGCRELLAGSAICYGLFSVHSNLKH